MPQPVAGGQPELCERAEAEVIGPKPPKQSKDIPARNRRLVEQRSGGVCESCGVRYASDIHHRQYRSRGGTHDVHNLIHLCGWGNHTGCHGKAHTDGETSGMSIRRGYRSVLIPMLRRGVWVLPDDDGGWQEISEATAEFIMSNGGRP